MNIEEVFEAIEEADRSMIDEYLEAALNRKRELYLDWEICYVALPKDAPEEKKQLLNSLREILA